MRRTNIPFKPGLLVRVKFYYDDEYPRFWDNEKEMGEFMNKIVTIRTPTKASDYKDCYHIKEDGDSNGGGGFFWRDIDFQKVNTPCKKSY